MIDARADSDDEDEVMEDPYKKKLTDIEIVLTSISFLLAGKMQAILQHQFKLCKSHRSIPTGHETTNNALGYTSYLLALNPDKQEKLFQEISEFYSKKPVNSMRQTSLSIVVHNFFLQQRMPPCMKLLRVSHMLIW